MAIVERVATHQGQPLRGVPLYINLINSNCYSAIRLAIAIIIIMGSHLQVNCIKPAKCMNDKFIFSTITLITGGHMAHPVAWVAGTLSLLKSLCKTAASVHSTIN